MVSFNLLIDEYRYGYRYYRLDIGDIGIDMAINMAIGIFRSVSLGNPD